MSVVIAGEAGSAGRVTISVLVRGSTCAVPRLRQRRSLLQQRRELLGLRVAELPLQRPELAGVVLRVEQRLALVLFRRQHARSARCGRSCRRRVAELVGAQDDVERLIPRHVAQRDVHGALHRRIDDDVQAADLGERAQHGAQIGALEVEADRVAGELAAARSPGPADRPCGAGGAGGAAAVACGGRASCAASGPAARRNRLRTGGALDAGVDDRRRSAGAAVEAERAIGSRRRRLLLQRQHRVGRAARRWSRGRRQHVRRRLRRRLVEVDDDGVAIAADVVRDRLRRARCARARSARRATRPASTET